MAGVKLEGKWELPSEGSTGNVKHADDNSIGLSVSGTEVSLETLVQNDVGQQWEIGVDEGSGYFTIMNPASGKFFAATNTDQLKMIIQGKYAFLFS